MSSRRKFFLTFVFIIIDAVLLVGFFVVRDAAFHNCLKKEVESLSKLDMTKDRYNTKLRTRGTYRVIERSMKSYLDQNAVLLQDSLKVVKDPQLTKILSYENYQEDGPVFKKSLSYLETTKKQFNENMDTVLLNLEEKTITKYINIMMKDSYYRAFYKELMLNDAMKSNFMETKELAGSAKNRINKVLDTSTEVLNFLVSHQEDWVLEEGEIRFRTQDLYNQYMSYINSINS